MTSTATSPVSGLALIAVANAQPMPWRNGGGVTRELFTWPAAASGTPWQLRISVADITQDGPFSAFAGIERWFVVLQGAGVRLGLPAGERVLTTNSAPLCFAGEDAPACALLHGATRDLNLMAQRAAGQAAMQRAVPALAWVSPSPLRALFTAQPMRLQRDNAPPLPVPAMTLAIATQAGGQRWRALRPGGGSPTDASGPAHAKNPASAWWLEFQPTTLPSPTPHA